MLYTKATQCDGYCTYHLMLLSCFPQEPPRPLLALRLLRLNSSFLIFFLSASIVESFLIYSYYTPVLMKINPVLSQSHSAAVYRIMQYQQQHRCNNSIVPTEKKNKTKRKDEPQVFLFRVGLRRTQHVRLQQQQSSISHHFHSLCCYCWCVSP